MRGTKNKETKVTKEEMTEMYIQHSATHTHLSCESYARRGFGTQGLVPGLVPGQIADHATNLGHSLSINHITVDMGS